MSDVFISYSRTDKDFVQRLFAALETSGRDAWVDWEDIPFTADWWSEIKSGIEAANTFIFVVTPNSLSSAVCALEVAHAISNNKRLIPIVRATVDEQKTFEQLAAYAVDENMSAHLAGRRLEEVAQQNWKELSRHNWIFFDKDDRFTPSFQALLTAIDTDLDYVRDHTRTLMRAHEWDRSGRNPSFLLRGTDLRHAENWSAQGRSSDPKPTGLQLVYILDSRRAERRRQRNLLAGVTVALGVSIGLAVLSFILFRSSQANEARANDNAATAVANEQLASNNAATAIALGKVASPVEQAQ